MVPLKSEVRVNHPLIPLPLLPSSFFFFLKKILVMQIALINEPPFFSPHVLMHRSYFVGYRSKGIGRNWTK